MFTASSSSSLSKTMTKRTSFITHSPDYEQDYTIKRLSNHELLELLHEFGLQVHEQDILNPTPARITLLFECFIFLLRPWRIPFIDAERAKVIKLSQSVAGAYETQTFAEAIIIYKEFKSLLQQIRFSQFNLSDLLEPDSQRIVPIINAVVNYGMFTEHAWDFFGPVAETSDQLALQANQAQDRENELQAKINEARRKLQEDEETAKQLYQENEALALQVQAARKESDRLVEIKTHYRQIRADLKDTMQSRQTDVITILDLITRFKKVEHFDSDKAKENIAQLRTNIDTEKQERDYQKETMKAYDIEVKLKRSVYDSATRCDQILTTATNTKKETDRQKKTHVAIKQEILDLEIILKDLQNKYTFIERNLEQYNLKIAQIQQQQEKKRESMKAFYEESQVHTEKADEEFQKALTEVAQIELEVEDVRNKVNAVRDGHRQKMSMVAERLNQVESKITRLYKYSENNI